MLTAEITNGRRPVGQVTAGSVVARQGRRIGFFGLFGSGNFGNDGSLEAMIGLVRRKCPDARLVCFCDGPERVQKRLGIEAIAIKSSMISAADRSEYLSTFLPGASRHG